MTHNIVRVKVRCKSCRRVAQLTPEQYKVLLKGEQLSLSCPRCGHQFVFSAMDSSKEIPALAPPAPPETKAITAPQTKEIPVPPPAPVPAPIYEPPPFAPLQVGGPAPAAANTPAPHFPPLGDHSPEPAPRATKAPKAKSAPASGEQKLSFNDRFKRLPQWVQWLIVVLLIVVVGAIVLNIPMGGSGSKSTEAAPAKQSTEKNASPSGDSPADSKPTPEKQKP
jgi:hypothetical protein